ncbi:MAG: DOMON-like domain-containing protein [Cyanobium sp.]
MPPAPAPFALVPFPGDPAPAGLAISGNASRHAGRLTVHYRLEGALGQLLIPSRADSPQRRDELWQTTCLECFLARPGDAPYWEVNLSPCGHWNVYRLEEYRLGLTPEPTVTQAPAGACRRGPGRFELTLELTLPTALAEATALEVGITAVIEERSGAISYWALIHPGPQADFHRREGFAITL